MRKRDKVAIAAAIGVGLACVGGRGMAQAASISFEPALTATGVNTARNLFHVDGSGIKIGVISDSFNTARVFNQFGNQDTYVTDISNGYLPSGIQVLGDYDGSNTSFSQNDEGRALLEVIHAIAPGASLAFAPA